MTIFPHDQFAKDYLKQLLTPLGEVETSRKVAGEVREIDVWVVPSTQQPRDAKMLGLLGRLAAERAIFEPYREDRNLIMRLSAIYEQRLAEATEQGIQQGVQQGIQQGQRFLTPQELAIEEQKRRNLAEQRDKIWIEKLRELGIFPSSAI